MSEDKDKALTKRDAHILFNQLKPHMASALPKHVTPERMARIALTEWNKTPKLQKCTANSLMKCIMVSAQMGLEPGPLGHVYFIPYGNEAQLIIGYRGMIDLARRSGNILSIMAEKICENDVATVKHGSGGYIEHSEDLRKARGSPIGYYAIAKLVGGGEQFVFLRLCDVEKVRKSSKSANNGPWITHYDEMAKKTAIRRLFKYLPMSVEVQKIAAVDETDESGVKQSTVIDEAFFDVDLETGEILNAEDTKEQADALADKIK
jgi:recombination protein RecT